MSDMTRQTAGFTLIELIVTMILIGTMAFVAMPRFSSLGAFGALGAADQTVAYLRFAQKTALAQRRFVTVAVTNAATAPVMTIGTACNAGTALTYPVAFKVPTSTVTLGGAGNICFDTLGGVSATATLTFTDDTGALVRTVTVEGTTGYVHAS